MKFRRSTPPFGSIPWIVKTILTGSCMTMALANDIERGKEYYTASVTPKPIMVDGVLGEWNAVPQVSSPKFSVPKGTAGAGVGRYVVFEEYGGGVWAGLDDQSSAIQVVYDAENVYLGFVVTDDFHENSAKSAWNGDSIQLMITDADRRQQVALYNYALAGVDGSTGDVIVMHEAGPGGTEAVVTRDSVSKKTVYEIKLPAASMGRVAPLIPGVQFGLGFAINDGDNGPGQEGQKGWGGLGTHAIVFGKSPNEAALITLGGASFNPTPFAPFEVSSVGSLLKNGGFETGDFTGWTQVGDTGSCYVEDGNGWKPRRNPDSGNYLSAFGNDGPGGIQQEIDTEPGEFYTVEFAFLNDAWTANDFYFQATWDGEVVLDFKKPEPASGWRYHRYTVQAKGTRSKVGFVTKPAGYFNLDSIAAYKSGPEGQRSQYAFTRILSREVDFNSAGGFKIPGGTDPSTLRRPSGGASGGLSDGYLSLTDARGGQRATVVIDDVTGSAWAKAFSFECDLRIGAGTQIPADGFSLNYVRPDDPLLANGSPFAGTAGETDLAEEGSQTGLAVGFDTWQNGDHPDGIVDVVGISIRVDGRLVTQLPVPLKPGNVWPGGTYDAGPFRNLSVDDVGYASSLQTGSLNSTDDLNGDGMVDGNDSNAPQPDVSDPNWNLWVKNLKWERFKVDAAEDGKVRVFWKGIELTPPGGVATAFKPGPGRLVLGARTGGAWEVHHVDNVRLSYSMGVTNRLRWRKTDGGNDHHYAVITQGGQPISWNQANEMAKAFGGHLATVTSKEENDFLYSISQDLSYWQDVGNGLLGPWIGARSGPSKRLDDWQWVTGEPWGYTAWNPFNDDQPTTSEPNGGGDAQPFVSFTGQTFAGTKPYWNDNWDSQRIPSFIVEWGVDADQDGLPDFWENLYGFSDNDPSDAKADPDNDGADNLAEFQAGTEPRDTTPPVLLGAIADASGKRITLTFSENIDPVTGGGISNFTLSPSLEVISAVVNGHQVTLTTAPQNLNGTEYSVLVNNVQDIAKVPIMAGAKATFYSFVSQRVGALKFSVWRGIGGNSVQDLLNDPRYPSQPDLVAGINSFNSRDAFPNNDNERYGATIEGILIPPENGEYRFFVSSDDAGRLELSPDEDPANLVQIASEDGCCNPFTEPENPRVSVPVNLVAGKRYYIRLIYKEGVGGDYGMVAWRKEGDTTPARSLKPIPGYWLESTSDVGVSPFGFVQSVTPAPGSNQAGNTIEIIHVDGRTVQTPATTSLEVDGVRVAARIRKTGPHLIVDYTGNFLPSSRHVARLNYLDIAGNPTSYSWDFNTNPLNDPKTIFIEAEDFDFDGGQTLIGQKIGMDGRYSGGAFEGKGGVAGVDYNNPGGNFGQPYRASTGVAAGKGPNRLQFPGAEWRESGRERGLFELDANYTVGWNDVGDWQNYTRTFPTPARKYSVYGFASSGGAPIELSLDQVVSGVGTDNQSLRPLAQLKPGRATAGWDHLELFQFTDPVTNGPCVVELGGKVTLRLSVPGGNVDIDYLAFIPIKESDPAKASPTELVAWWDFETLESDRITLKSVVGSYSGQIQGNAALSFADGGRPGGGKGFAVSPETNRGRMLIEALGEANPLNVAAAQDNLSITVWQKNNSTPNSSTFWAVSEDSDRSSQAHIPWSDQILYWDTGGCCEGNTRLQVGAPSDHDYRSWHLYTFVKRGDIKEVWIDGRLLKSQDGYKPHSARNTKLAVGSDLGGALGLDATIDDFAIWRGALSPAQIRRLASGTKPSDLLVDTDQDGMVDDWENQFGLNPNDATDAKADPDSDGIENLTEYNMGTDPKDMTPPTILRAVADRFGTNVTLVFSERIDPVTGGAVANYNLSRGVAVVSASVKGDKVILTTSQQNLLGVEYTVSVSNIQDLSKRTIAGGSRVNFVSPLAKLPPPIWIETFDSTAEGGIPNGWTFQNFTTGANGQVNYGDPGSDAYLNWVVIPRSRVESLGWDAVRRLNVASQFVNGEPVATLVNGNILYAESDTRSGSQIQYAFSPDIPLGGRANIYLSFHSIYEQNQDSLGAVEYSIDQGATWLPALYMLDGPDIVKDSAGNVDGYATMAAANPDTAAYADPLTGEARGGNYGSFIGVAQSEWKNLGPFISARVNDDPVESKRVEVLRLPKADLQPSVRLRFAQAGTASWYFGIDNVGVYSIPPVPPRGPGSSSYELMDNRVTWDQAKMDAELRGGHLVTITSQQEWDAIKGQLMDRLRGKITWIGANDRSQPDHWEWVTGESFSFSPWHPNEPNGSGSVAVMGWDSPEELLWDDYGDGNSLLPYLIEWESDVDQDGLPDAWESRYGFNVNDPSNSKEDPDNDGIDNLSEFKAGTDPRDTVPPVLVGATVNASGSAVLLIFNENVDPVTAGELGNYSIAPGLPLTVATVNGHRVTLGLGQPMVRGAEYRVLVSGVRDLSKKTMLPTSKIIGDRVVMLQGGLAKFSAWYGIGGTDIQTLLSDPRYPAKPDFTTVVASLNSGEVFPDTAQSNYGAMLEAVLTPTESGSYRFFTSSDDSSQLYLSTDETESNLRKIAEEVGCCQPFLEPDNPKTSEPIALTAGKSYLLRFIYKEAGGADYGVVAWRKEGDATPAQALKAIDGRFLAAPIPEQGLIKSLTPRPLTIQAGNRIEVVHVDGRTVQTAATTRLEVDGFLVNAKIEKVGIYLTVAYEANFAPNTHHTAKVHFLDVDNQPTSFNWAFSTSPMNDPGVLVIEAEDFDFGGGQTIADQKIGMNGKYSGGAFNGKDGIPGVDYNNPGGNAGQPYRALTGVAAGKGPSGGGLNRGLFDLEVNYTVGWNDVGDWQNYTRTFPSPARKYAVYGFASSGGGPIELTLDQVISGVGTETQSLKTLAELRPGRATAGWDSLELFQFTDPMTKGPATVELGGKVTLRLTVPGGNVDIDYLAFVPITDDQGISRYGLVDRGMTWDQAKADAEARGGHLATITSQEEWGLIKGQLQDQLRGKIIWIGANDRETPNQWQWITGEPFGFSPWHPGEPNGSGNVAVMGWDSPEELLWDDYGDGNSIFPYLIEWEIDRDQDGMPDRWELRYGFNPRDPSDLAADPDNDGINNLDEYKASTDPRDMTPPTLVNASADPSGRAVTLVFSERIDSLSASIAGNYSITPSLGVLGVTVRGDRVTLVTTQQALDGIHYTVTVNGVRDLSKKVIANDSKIGFYSFMLLKEGVLRFSVWRGIAGNSIQDLVGDPRYPSQPDIVRGIYSFNSRDIFSDDQNDNYGAVIDGCITPLESGNYRFFIFTDDNGRLEISPDENPANLVQIAEEVGCCNPFTEPDSPRTSSPIYLVGGKKYFIRLIYKEGGGGDYGMVAWRKEGDPTPAVALRPVDGAVLSSPVGVPVDPVGLYTQVTPSPGSSGVSPATSITITHQDGKVSWTPSNVVLKFDGQVVVPNISKSANTIVINYTPPALLESRSTHTVILGYQDLDGKPASYEYNFTVASYNGVTVDKVGGYPGLMMGAASYTVDAGGASGKPGDRAIDLTLSGGSVLSVDKKFVEQLSAATAKDELTIAFWQKLHDITDGSAFNVNSPTAPLGRVFHAHAPWSNQHVYFDTMGCCNGVTQRIEAGIETHSGYSGDKNWWMNSFHHFAFTKKGAVKTIWIDGKLFLSGENTAPLSSDVNAFYMGAGSNGENASHAVMDDFAIFGRALESAEITALAQGTLPNAIDEKKQLIAYWDFNADSNAGGAETVFKIQSLSASSAEIEIPVIVEGFKSVGTIQFSIGWNASALEYRGVSGFNLPGVSESNFGTSVVSGKTNRIAFSWDDNTLVGVTLENGARLFNLRFRQVSGFAGKTDIVFENTPAPLEVTVKSKAIPVKSINAVIMMASSLGGVVEYYMSSGGRVAGVKVGMSNGNSATTDIAGSYMVNYQPGDNYTLLPSYSYDAPVANGVTTADITLIRRHVLGLALLDSPYKVMAGDVNGTDSVTTADITLIRRLILGSATSYPTGLWRFVPSDELIPDALKPWTASRMRRYATLAGGLITGQDFKAVKLGDVNGSWKAPAAGTSSLAKSRPKTRLTIGKAFSGGTERIEIPVTVVEETSLSSLQMTLEWDPIVADYEAMDGVGEVELTQANLGLGQVSEGRISLSWDHVHGKSIRLPAGGQLFRIRFKSKGSPKRTEVRSVETPTPFEITDQGEVVLASIEAGSFEILNPNNGNTSGISLRFVGPDQIDVPVLEVRAPKGLSVVLEVAEKLDTWSPVDTIVGLGADTPITIRINNKPDSTTVFWRVRVK